MSAPSHGTGRRLPAGRAPTGAKPSFRSPKVKGFLLFALPLPLLLASIIDLGSGSFAAMIAEGSAFALYMLGALLTRRGLARAASGPQSRYGPRPWLSPTNLGAGLVALATAIAAYFGVGHGVATSVAFAGVALLAFHLLYGLDPIYPPRILDSLGGERDAVSKALAEAEQRIHNIEHASAAIGNLELRTRLGRISEQGRDILAMIERRPRDLRRARKFLTVYLEGAEQVTRGYAGMYRVADSPELEQNFRNVLVTIESVFAEQQRKLLETDVMDLDVQIEVLSKQLKREGIL